MALQKPKILLVDDKPQNLYALRQLLQVFDIEPFQCTSGAEALALTLDHEFFAAIVDVQMPEMDGYELVELLRGNESTANLPVIFVSAIYSDEYHHRRAYDAGAVDFLSKPFVPEILLSKIKVFLDLYQQHQRLQNLVEQLNAANWALSRRAVQLETSAQVSHRLTSILDLDQLLNEIAALIQNRFGYYFIGVWLMMPQPTAVILQASRWQGLNPPIEPGMVIAIDDPRQVVAKVSRTGHFHYDHGLRAGTLEDTGLCRGARARLVLPLRVGPKFLGVLEIQDLRPDIFDDDAVTVLQSQADQIAIVIRNAQLYAEVTRLNNDLELKVRERTAELEESNRRLELIDHNKSTFIQVVSHELRTPLTLIKGFSQILLKETLIQQNPTYQQEVNGIVMGAERMHDIVNSMLDVVKIDNKTMVLKAKLVNLSELLGSVLQSVNEAMEDRQLMLSLEPMADLPPIEADPEAMFKLFSHLIFNAVKYTPNGGAVTISGRLLAIPRYHENGGSDFVEIVVSDTGIGIDPDFQELIFVKFYCTGEVSFHSSGKTKFKGGGPGLGLAIARGIVEAHGGKIWVESSGHDEILCPGSRFHVVLPMKQGLLMLGDRVLELENAGLTDSE